MVNDLENNGLSPLRCSSCGRFLGYAAIADGLTERRAEDLLARSDVISMRLRRYLDKLRRTQAAPTNQTRPALGLETRA